MEIEWYSIRKLILSILFFTLICPALSQAGAVRSKKEALRIAEQRLIEKFGNDVLKQKPFKVTDTKLVWKIEGTSQCQPPEQCRGGVAKIEIRKKDGIVLHLYQEQ